MRMQRNIATDDEGTIRVVECIIRVGVTRWLNLSRPFDVSSERPRRDGVANMINTF